MLFSQPRRAGNSSWSSVDDPRLGSEHHAGTMGVSNPARPSATVLAAGDIHNSPTAIADPRLGERADRQNGGFGVNNPGAPAHAVLGEGTVRNTFASVIDPRVSAQHRGNYGVEDSADPSSCVRGTHVVRTAPASIADCRLFEPTHQLVAGQPLTVAQKAWVAGDFELLGPEVDVSAGGRPQWLVIEAPDGCFHRPMTDLELAMLQGLPVWHRPGDPTELAIGAPGGQWLELAGSKKQRREQIGNAVPPATAQAIAERVLELLDAGDEQVFRLSNAGVWVRPRRTHGEARTHRLYRQALLATSRRGIRLPLLRQNARQSARAPLDRTHQPVRRSAYHADVWPGLRPTAHGAAARSVRRRRDQPPPG